MAEVQFKLNEGWETVDEVIDFFLNLVLQLQVLKHLPDPPTNWFIYVEGTEIPDEDLDGLEINLMHL